MNPLDPTSLAATLNAVNEAFFYAHPPTKPQRERLAKWIASRVAQPRSYADMPAPTDKDYADGVTLFTGEQVRTRAGTGHILGEEACRALILLGFPTVRDALHRASTGIQTRLDATPIYGMYCCGICSVALWRHWAVGGLDHPEKHLAAAMTVLHRHRKPDGQWTRFPFYYTLLALTEIDLPSATAELRHAAPVCERRLKRRADHTPISQRRRDLLERVLARC